MVMISNFNILICLFLEEYTHYISQIKKIICQIRKRKKMNTIKITLKNKSPNDDTFYYTVLLYI